MSLVNGVIQFWKSITNFFAITDRFKALNKTRLGAMLFSEGWHFYRVISNKSWLHQIGLTFFTKYLIDQFTFAHCFIHRHMQLPTCVSQSNFVHFGNINTGKMMDRFKHREPFPGSLKVDQVLSHFHLRGAMKINRYFLNHFLYKIHHPLIIFIRYVQLYLCKFGVVKAWHAFVAKVFWKFIHTIETTYNQSLEIKFVGDAQVERHVQRIVVCLERAGRRTTIQRLQHGRLHLQIALIIQVLPHGVNELCAFDKCFSYLRIYNQINITHAIA